MSRTSLLRRIWNSRAVGWHEHVTASSAFGQVRASLVDAVEPRPCDRVVDLGAGSGFVTLALARSVAHVLAVDLSEAMLDLLTDEAARKGLDNVSALVGDLAGVDLRPASVDAIVSSYALHHLTDDDKAALVARARQWLRPGGRLVIADMMFGRGRTARDREILRMKVRSLLRKGPGGVWRIAKNLLRFGLRRGTELPASPEFWVSTLKTAGFEGVRYESIVAEAGLVYGRVGSGTSHGVRLPGAGPRLPVGGQ